MPTQQQWEQRWQTQNTPWDLNAATPALISWVSQSGFSGESVLVPGCGQGHDAHFMAKNGAEVTAVDISDSALSSAASRYPNSQVSWQKADVLALKPHSAFDRVWEYTCFCALEPRMRAAYIRNIHQVLKPGGTYWGLVFTLVPKPDDGPPFQIDAQQFKSLLACHFNVEVFETNTQRSIRARQGKELWFEARKVES